VGHDEEAKGMQANENGGDASRAKIGVAHNRLRFAAGQMSSETMETVTLRAGAWPED
jgi:hypothetical protein